MKQTLYIIGLTILILAGLAGAVVYHIQEAQVRTQIAINILGKLGKLTLQ